MIRFATLLRRAGAWAALAGLLTQSVLPAAHAWVVDTQEAAYHASVHDAAAKASLCDSHGRGHHHHSGADCRLCPLYSSARLAAVHGTCAADAPGLVPSLPDAASGLCPSANVAGAPVRGPPEILPA